jgi:glutamate carboxypeptidase
VEVAGDLRALTPEQFAKAQQAMTDIVDASLPHARATLTFDPLVPPLAPAAGNMRLLEMYSRASMDLGLGPVAAVDPDRAGAADVSFAAGRAAMILDGLGLMGRDGHSARETADLDTLGSQTKRAAVLLWRLSRR